MASSLFFFFMSIKIKVFKTDDENKLKDFIINNKIKRSDIVYIHCDKNIYEINYIRGKINEKEYIEEAKFKKLKYDMENRK